MNTPTSNLHDLASKIAAALGPEWTPDPCTQNCRHESTHLRYIDDPQYALFISLTWAGKGKLHISGNTPRGQHRSNGLRYDEHAISINVSDQKTPEQIAKDITRRLLPSYQEQYTRAKAAVEAYDASETKREAMHAQAYQLIKDYDNAHRDQHHAVDVYLKSTSSTTCRVELTSMTLDQLKAILAVIS